MVLITVILMVINTLIIIAQDWQNLGGPPVAKDVRDISAG